MEAVLLAHVAATWAMVGLIWFVQIVHYPLFAAVGTATFTGYEARHRRRTAAVVAVFMPAEAVTAVWLALAVPEGVGRALVLAGLALVTVLWVSTAAWQAPLHGKLTSGFEAGLHRRLVRSNWLRTVLWSVRGVVVLAMMGRALG